MHLRQRCSVGVYTVFLLASCVAATASAVSPITRVINVPPDSLSPLFQPPRGDDLGTYVVPSGTELNVNEFPVGLPSGQEFLSVRVSGGVVNYDAPRSSMGQPGPRGFTLRSGEINFRDGFTENLFATAGTATISGGFVANATPTGDSLFVIEGGEISVLDASGGQTTISGGSVTGRIMVGNFSPTGEPARVAITGGEIAPSFLIAETRSIIEISGGVDFSRIFGTGIEDNGEIGILGHSFMIDGVPVAGLDVGESIEITQRDVTLSGVYEDGTSFSVGVSSGAGGVGQITVASGGLLRITAAVPEPSSIGMLALLVTSAARHRRSS